MLIQTAMALVIAGNTVLTGAATSIAPDHLMEEAGIEEAMVEARYEAAKSEVSNWRGEATEALNPTSVIMLASMFGVERPVVTRCVKLNNYWCIKSARWNGEIGRDSEGHVGFASAGHSADAAATLLRRYYLEFDRKSALDIVRRWAPAECNLFTGFTLAVKGISGTVRAKYLAANRVRITAAPPKNGQNPGRVRVSIVMSKPLPQYRVPDIAAGMGEKPKPQPQPKIQPGPKPAPKATAKAAPSSASTKVASAAPTSCAPDEVRLQNYAARMVEGLGLKPTDDLKLFEADGTPRSTLAPIMLAMSGFELGLLKPDPALIEGAVQRATLKAAEARQGEKKSEP